MNLFTQQQQQEQPTSNLVHDFKNTIQENRQIRNIKKCINRHKVTEFDRLRKLMINELKK